MRDESLVFVNHKPIGRIMKGVFIQMITRRHIFRLTNSKGIDESALIRVEHECHTWRLIFKDTKEILSIPVKKIRQVGKKEPHAAGIQYMVCLGDFNQDQPALQKAFI